MRTPTPAHASLAYPAGGARTGTSTGAGAAHAKAILLGEHAAVYGAPALALPVHGLGVHADVAPAEAILLGSELFTGPAAEAPARLWPVLTAVRAALDHQPSLSGARVQIRSSVPYERGLGSSAAVAAAVARAVADLGGAELSPDALYGIVQEAERVAHGHPSGLDARAVTAGGPIRFQRGQASPVRVGSPLVFTLADSGASGSTAQAVAQVRARRDADPAAVDTVIDRIATLTEAATGDLTRGDGVALGERMTQTHHLLAGLGVSDHRLDALVAAALAAGAAGAKLTGGGQGGCIIALARSTEHAEQLGSALRAAGAPRTWTTTVPAR
ncbi:mevalonate kinase [Ruania albidiflava]|uniref:mevalonate kinase n=1 Tax=Ruania albidiflava TaxID=366586 RepID=UPI0023F50ACB|nr:mevalonate kinase [Ruania albidiflava]